MDLPTNTVAHAFAQSAAQFGARPFLAVLPETATIYVVPAGETTYAQMLARIEPLRAAYAAAGYGHGHRVGLLLENRPAFFVHWFALNGLGVSVVPINLDLRSAELEYLVAHSEIAVAPEQAEEEAPTVDLMEALRRSVEEAKSAKQAGNGAAKKKAAPKKASARPKKTATR